MGTCSSATPTSTTPSGGWPGQGRAPQQAPAAPLPAAGAPALAHCHCSNVRCRCAAGAAGMLRLAAALPSWMPATTSMPSCCGTRALTGGTRPTGAATLGELWGAQGGSAARRLAGLAARAQVNATRGPAGAPHCSSQRTPRQAAANTRRVLRTCVDEQACFPAGAPLGAASTLMLSTCMTA